MNARICFAIALIALMLCACSPFATRGSGNVIRETRQVSDFDRVNICCGWELIITQGSEESLEIEAEDNILPEITTVVRGGVLDIGFERGNWSMYWPTKPVRCYLTMKEIRGIGVSGGGKVEAAGIETDHLLIDLSGGSQARIGTLNGQSIELRTSGGSTAQITSLNAQTLIVGISGGGGATVSGAVSEQRIDLSGGSHHRAADLQSQSATLDLSGGSDATIWVTKSLTVGLSGGSRVEYYGSPSITEDLSGGSTLIPRGGR